MGTEFCIQVLKMDLTDQLEKWDAVINFEWLFAC
jgi:hypothetical protein